MSDPGFPADRVMDEAVSLHQQGRLSEAEALYRRILQTEPDHPDALHLLGVIAYQAGRDAEASGLIARAIALNQDIPEYHSNLGNALRRMGRPAEAAHCFRRALRLAPAYAVAHSNLGLALRDMGKCAEAVASFRAALRLRPDIPEIHNNLGVVLRDLGKIRQAVDCYEEALRLRPDYAEAFSNLGAAHQALGRLDEAAACYEKALRLAPRLVEAVTNLGSLLRETGRSDEAAKKFEEALRIQPDDAMAHVNLAALLHDQGEIDRARHHYDRALSSRPGLIAARWGRCMARIEILHDSPEALRAGRESYRSDIENLSRSIDTVDPAAVEAAANAACGSLPFFLSYQGENDVELQRIHGELIHRILSARYPKWADGPPQRRPAAGERLRIGIVSAYFHYHSNWKIPIRGWAQNLDRRRFTLYGYYTGSRRDAETAEARASFEHFVEGTLRLEDWCRAIAADRLHVLIYPEVGMHSTTMRMASLRLAPVQCASWGHPETTGLPTIDYFLSSDLMEPEGGEAHYSEQLVRLPNLSIHYSPLAIQPSADDRASLGLRRDATVLLCAQSLFKYLPQYDDVFPRIARAAEGCQFAFLGFGGSKSVDDRFMARLNRAFARHDMRAQDHVVLLQKLEPSRYQALNRACDLFLDSIGWSGCNSTLEAIQAGLPVVTLPGTLMRGRHSAAFLRRMGIQDTIAGSVEEYVGIAARLVRDTAERRRCRERIEQNREKLYADMECIRGLEAFLARIVRGAA